MASVALTSEDQIRKRFHLARLILDGQNNGEPLPASEVWSLLGISRKTHTRDIARAREALTFDEWVPKKRGPKPGKRRVAAEVDAMAVDLVYERKTQKRNKAKAARDLCSRALLKGRVVTYHDEQS